MELANNSIKELFDQLSPLLHKERGYYDFKRICETIETIIEKRIAEKVDNDNSSANYLNAALLRLSRTIGKEVGFIKDHQDKMHKKNAAKVRAVEYYEAVHKAYKQVYLNILVLMQDEENLNKE